MLAHQAITLVVAVLTLALTAALYIAIPKGLFPVQDTGQLLGRIDAATSVSYTRMGELQQAAARAILEDPAVASLSSFVGVDGANNTQLNTGRVLINLKSPRGDPGETMERLRERVRAGGRRHTEPAAGARPDHRRRVRPHAVPGVPGRASSAVVAQWAGKLAQALQDEPSVRSVVNDAGAVGVSAYVKIDRDSAARLSLSAANIDDALYSAFGQRIVSTIFTETNQYRVIIEARPDLLSTPESLGLLHLRTGSGTPTPLSAVATISERTAPLQITRVAQYPATTLGFDTAPGVSLGKAVDAIRAAAVRIDMPASVTMTFLGAAGAYQASLTNQLWLILAAVVCVYIVLGVLYESYIHPMTILSTLPSAGVGALLALMVSGQDLGGDRHHRHHPADRHRQEERDHDDRLCH